MIIAVCFRLKGLSAVGSITAEAKLVEVAASEPQKVLDIKPAIAVVAGNQVSCALHSDDSVSSWGRIVEPVGVDQGAKSLPMTINFLVP